MEPNDRDSLRRMKERDRKRKYRARLSEEKKQEYRDKCAEYMRNKRLTTPEEEQIQHHPRAIHVSNNSARHPIERTIDSNLSDPLYLEHMNCEQQINIADDVETEQSIKNFQEVLQRTNLSFDEVGYSEGAHKAIVCVVCDCFITGVDPLHWIPSTTLYYHRNVLSSSYFYSGGLKTLLKLQYKVDDEMLSELLLSPRARHNVSSKEFSCCDSCYSVLQELKFRKNPPKYAISNGFAIGSLPDSLLKEVTPIINNVLAPVRAFNFFLSFMGGREKKIIGNFTFFSQDVAQNMGALQHMFATNNLNPCIFIILLGSFTPTQLNKIKKHGSYNVEIFKAIYAFFVENNIHYANFPSPDDVPLPRVEQIRLNEEMDDMDEQISNVSTEEEICWQYWFPSHGDPNSFSGTFKNQSEFARALFVGETPTLLFHPTKVVSHAKLSQICPIAFPFGTGDVDCHRKPFVSEIECFQHYMKLSLPQFQEAQTILIIHHIYQRRKSFLTGIAKCNLTNGGNTIADQISSIQVNQIDDAISLLRSRKKDDRQPSIPPDIHAPVLKLLKCVKTSCSPIGYTNEAAADARNKLFALWMTFGVPSLLFTFSPCDECSFRMQLYAMSNKVSKLPSPNEHIEELFQKLALRKSLRIQFPGACAREFDSLLQCIIKLLIGWDEKKTKHQGIFGRIVAVAPTIEEQGRTTLHGHLTLWVLNYHVLQQQLFSNDPQIRQNAVNNLHEYFKKVMCSSFEVSEEEVHQGVVETHKTQNCRGIPEPVPLQKLREMRHREHLKEHKGKVVVCNDCEQSWDTVEVIYGVVKNLFHLSREEVPGLWSDGICFPLKYEQLENLALRYQYDVIQIPESAKATRRLLLLLVTLFFNTHDWHHRKACFKKSNECRFHIPKKPISDFDIIYNKQCWEEPATENVCRWYHHDGNYHNICSHDIVCQRSAWDVFINTNNPIVSKLVGYNNNICMGGINVLYYCTLYTSKSNQEEETYPYIKALEAVAQRLKRVQENGSECMVSSRQIGLRNLLSGINAHVSSCVVSATMAWYLVTHGTRFHFVHEFKPLLLSQFEAWYHGNSISHRIRYKKRRKRCHETDSSDNDANVWLDSSVNNYLFRPTNPDQMFQNMCLWEYESRFELKLKRLQFGCDQNTDDDTSKEGFQFDIDHPGYLYSSLVERKKECIPKLYYSNKFPDVEQLEINKGDDVDDTVKELREEYALKALLLFYPFRLKEDFLKEGNDLWTMYRTEKNRLKESLATNICMDPPHLFIHSPKILQNIQDLLNVKRIPPNEEQLQSCTAICQTDSLNNSCFHEHEMFEENNATNNYNDSTKSQVDEMTHYVNLLCAESSTFNNKYTEGINVEQIQSDPSTLSVVPSHISTTLLHDDERDYSDLQNVTEDVNGFRYNTVTTRDDVHHVNTLITILTTVLQDDLSSVIPLPNNTVNNDVNMAFNLDHLESTIYSMDHYATMNNLDRKQSVAFKTICSSFMLSFLMDSNLDIDIHTRNHLQQLLFKKGASQQLLMCVTGPGGSGKSHVIKCCRLYCKHFCDAIKQPFHFSVFPITATSNAAASLLQGMTIHSAAMLNSSVVQMELSTDVDWTMTKVLIIDEISMADKRFFKCLDKNLRILTGNKGQLYGGIHIVFTGDFMQLAPVQGIPIYKDFDDILWHQALNAAIFLDEKNHRFHLDTKWGEILGRVQIGTPTDDDIARMNERLIKHKELPTNVDCVKTKVAYGCYSNKMRNFITNNVFLKYVSQDSPSYGSSADPSSNTLIIKGVLTKQNRDVGLDFHKFIWAVCGDDNFCHGESVKIDPCLKLFKGCTVMINDNTQKKNGIVKGVLGNFIAVKWKTDCIPHVEDYHGFKVNCCHVHDLDSIIVRLQLDGKHVLIKPENFSCSIKLPHMTKKEQMKGYKLLQFPVNLSLAITGHKLQGMTLDILILSEINLTTNWLYVLLSRVKSLEGLFLMRPLSRNMFKPISSNLKRELEWLRTLEQNLLRRLDLM